MRKHRKFFIGASGMIVNEEEEETLSVKTARRLSVNSGVTTSTTALHSVIDTRSPMMPKIDESLESDVSSNQDEAGSEEEKDEDCVNCRMRAEAAKDTGKCVLCQL